MTDGDTTDIAEIVSATRRVDNLIEDCERYPYDDDYVAPYAAALAAVLRDLMDAGEVWTAVGAVHAYDDVNEKRAERQRQRHEQDRAAYAEAERRHALAIKVDCPYCGTTAGPRTVRTPIATPVANVASVASG